MISFGDEISAEKYSPFIRKIEEHDGNEIRFIVSLACKGDKEKEADLENIENEAIRELFSNSMMLCPDEKNTYEIVFSDYILYQTRNESYTFRDEYEIRKGKHFLTYEKSRLLDILPQLTNCTTYENGDAYPGKWKHYGIVCQFHIIDVVSCNEPTIRKIRWDHE